MKYAINYTETTMEAMIEEALADLEARGEKLPNSKVEE